MKTRIYLLLAFVAVATIAACSNAETPITYDCTGVTPTYNTAVKAILDANCATSGCHSANSKQNGIDLSNYGGAKSAASNKSFMGSMQHLSGYEAMPRGGSKLNDATLKILSCWANNGTPQ